VLAVMPVVVGPWPAKARSRSARRRRRRPVPGARPCDRYRRRRSGVGCASGTPCSGLLPG